MISGNRTILATLLACASVAIAAPAHAAPANYEAGPIWNQADAETKCPALANQKEGTWTGAWRTTQPGVMSVCEIDVPTNEERCFSLVQDRVAWNHAGNRQWNPDNIRNLCAATANPAATVNCFKGVMAVHDDWNRALDACRA